MKAFPLLALAATLALPAHALDLRKGDRVCLVGNTFAERLAASGYFETLLHARHGDKEVTLRSLAWPADTLTLQPRPQDCPTTDQLLVQQKASVVIACFGMNESFESTPEQFRRDLEAFIDRLAALRPDGSTPPRVVLVSPIAHEQLASPSLPLAEPRNRVLRGFVEVMEAVAREKKVEFVDLFRPFLEEYRRGPKSPLTENGIHLTESGEKLAAAVMDAALFGPPGPFKDQWPVERRERLRGVITDKNAQWFARWRPVNAFYVYGGRAHPHGVVSFPPEMDKLDQMIALRERRIWDLAQGKTNDTAIDDSTTRALPDISTNVKEDVAALSPEDEAKTFTMAEGFEISLFASEREFPELANPVQLTFDASGRLWLSVMPTYPQAVPRTPPDDKILILTDKDADGKADACKIFARGLHLPTGLELGYGGAFVAAQSQLLHLRDTDGDDVADTSRVALEGFGTEDSHHSISTFCWGPGGGLHMMEGTFHHSQIETPRGPVRLANAGVFSYEPAAERLNVAVTYNYSNPWGQTWDARGRHFIADASSGDNHFASPLAGWLAFPDKHRHFERFTPREAHVRPTAGCEFVSSRHFPDKFQGWWLLNNTIGFQGTRLFRLEDEGSSVRAAEWIDLVSSSHRAFRPVDLEFGPDGALYLVDWYNPLVGHTAHSFRDPKRDRAHGRIWRITAKGRDLVKPPVIAGAKTADLLALLRTPEDRTRYRIRRELAQRDTPQVLAAIDRFLGGLAKDDPDRARLALECLWVQQHHDAVAPALLTEVFTAPATRAAAVQVLRSWHDRIPDAVALLTKSAADDNAGVRLEAVVAASFLRSLAGVEIALAAAARPLDATLTYALGETLRALEPWWRKAIADGTPLAAAHPAGMAFLLSHCTNAELLALKPVPAVLREILRRDSLPAETLAKTARDLAGPDGKALETLLAALPDAAGLSLARTLAAWEPKELAAARQALTDLAASAPRPEVRTAAMAALLTIDDGRHAWTMAQHDAARMTAVAAALPLAPEASRTPFKDRLAPLLAALPDKLAADAARKVPAEARFIRISLPQRGTLSLTEVEVRSAGRNVAPSGSARQSSTAFNGVAERAIDGNSHGEWGRSTTTHTEIDDPAPWWELDLGRALPIDEVALTNRTDPGSDLGRRLDGFQLDLLDTERRPVFSHRHGNAGGRMAIPTLTDRSTALRAALVRAWVAIPGDATARLATLLPLVADPAVREAALAGLAGTDLADVPPDAAATAGEALAAILNDTPLAERTAPAFTAAAALASTLAASDAPHAATLKPLVLSEVPAALTLKADPLQLAFDQKELRARAGSVVALTFHNPGEQPHNVVIGTPGSLEAIGAAADALQADPAGLARGFVPDLPAVLHKSRLLQRGESQTLVFRAPDTPGDHVIVCTFPGHWRLMHAILKVEK